MLRLIGSLLLPELDTLRVVEMDNWGISSRFPRHSCQPVLFTGRRPRMWRLAVRCGFSLRFVTAVQAESAQRLG